MALSPQFLDELKHRFTLSDVVGRQVKLVRRGRESTGLCPFHSEKTPSFTVNDQKGFYHCFGCGAHGSVIDFVMNTQGMTFPETIEVLAGEVGMEVPKPSREEVERQKERATLTEVMQAVAQWYQTQLRSSAGKQAYDYIKGRGLTDETLDRFGMGYAPSSRSALKDAMMARDIGEDQLIETGMLIKPDSGGASYDRFRDRLMFPITDRQGRVIAFGGRALSKDAKAKYLNSPETSLFHKGATLYNWANARAASYDAGQVMVVEGYMDVIALAQYGINYAVAPLGTALTEEQIMHLWQMADEPILSFDGDNAGGRAAGRALERALPMLKPGKSLRFIALPDGEDPDSLVQAKGTKAIDELIDKASPLSEMLWLALTKEAKHSTPEQKAGLKKSVFVKLSEIQNDEVRALYNSDFKSRLWEKFNPKRNDQRTAGPRQNTRNFTRKKASLNRYSGEFAAGANYGFMQGVSVGLHIGRQQGFSHGVAFGMAMGVATGLLSSTDIGKGSGTTAVTSNLEKLLMLTLVNHPEIMIRHEEEIGLLEFTVPGLEGMRNALLEKASIGDTLDRETVHTHLETSGHMAAVRKMMGDKALRGDWFAWPEAALSDALTGFEHLMSRYQHITAAKHAYEQAEAEYAAEMTDTNHERFVAAQAAFRALEEKEADKDGYRLESGRFSFN